MFGPPCKKCMLLYDGQMTKFESLLQELNLTKAKFALSIRVQPGTVYRWKTDSDVPAVVMKYLECLKLELGKKR